MRALLTRGQFLLMRAIGMRKLREDLDARSDAARAELAARLDTLLAEIAFRGGPSGDQADRPNPRLEALGNQMSQQGKADTERGDTIQDMLRDLRAEVGELRKSASRIGGQLSAQGQADTERGDTVQNALADLRAAVSELHAEQRRQATSNPERGAGVEQALGEIRVEISSLRADLARENEVLLDRADLLGAVSGLHAELRQQATSNLERGAGVEQALGEIRVEISRMRADLARENEVLLDRIDGGGVSQSRPAPAS